MEELRLMTYDKRPRECKLQYEVPHRNDFIEVLWCMDHLPGLPDRWCTAEVLHISGTPTQENIANGVILYLPVDKWNEQVHKVEFLRNHRLRRTVDVEDDVEEADENGSPVLQWQFTTHDTASDRSDEDWQELSSIGKQQKKEVREGHTRSHAGDQRDTEISALRSGHAALLVEVEKLKREMVKQSHRISQLHSQDWQQQMCTSAGCVLPRLRHRLALKLQQSLRPVFCFTGKRACAESEENLSQFTGDGLHVGAVKVRVECSLLQFENLARQVKVAVSPDSVLFFPEFRYTQLPSQCSSAFRVLFRTCSILLEQIGISSFSDKLEIVRKCGSGPQGDLLRIMGTYAFEKDDKSSAAHLFLGTSCGKVAIGTNEGMSSMPGRYFPVLTRDNREWNKVDGCFTHRLRKENLLLPPLEDSVSDLETFSLYWKKVSEVGSRTWSKGLVNDTHVLGWLEICLPFIQAQGTQLCTEVGGMAPDEIWDEVFSREGSA